LTESSRDINNYDTVKLYVNALATEIDASLEELVEVGEIARVVYEDFIKYLNTVVNSIENCNFYNAGVNIGYLAVTFTELKQGISDPVILLKMGELYTLLSLMMDKSLNRCKQ